MLSCSENARLDRRQTDLEALGSALQQYREGHSHLIRWIEETTERQENTQPGQTDSRALSEQLAQQTVSNSGENDSSVCSKCIQ